MNIKDINVPLVMVAAIVMFTISGVFTIEYRYAKAEDMQQFQNNEAVQSKMLWIELLEMKLENAETTEERERIKRQIRRTEESLLINLEKMK